MGLGSRTGGDVIFFVVALVLSTKDHRHAMNGPRCVRRFRYATLWPKHPLDMSVYLVTCMLNALQVRRISDRRVVLWTEATTYRLSVGQTLLRLRTEAERLLFQEVGV